MIVVKVWRVGWLCTQPEICDRTGGGTITERMRQACIRGESTGGGGVFKPQARKLDKVSCIGQSALLLVVLLLVVDGD